MSFSVVLGVRQVTSVSTTQSVKWYQCKLYQHSMQQAFSDIQAERS